MARSQSMTPAVDGHKPIARAIADAGISRVHYWRLLKRVNARDRSAKIKRFQGQRADGRRFPRAYVPDWVHERVLELLKEAIDLDQITLREAEKLLGGKEGRKDLVRYQIDAGNLDARLGTLIRDKNGALRRCVTVSRGAVLKIVEQHKKARAARESHRTLRNAVKALKQILANGPVAARSVKKRMRDLGFRDLISAARKKLHVHRKRIERGGIWYVYLPSREATQPNIKLTVAQSHFALQEGEPVKLRPRLCQILQFFWRHYGEEISVQTLQKSVYSRPCSTGQPALNATPSAASIRDDIQDLRDVLREALQKAGTSSVGDPLPCTNAAPGFSSWRLSLTFVRVHSASSKTADQAATRGRRGPKISKQTLAVGGFCYEQLVRGTPRKVVCRLVQDKFGRPMSLSDVTTYARRFATNPDDPRPWPV